MFGFPEGIVEKILEWVLDARGLRATSRGMDEAVNGVVDRGEAWRMRLPRNMNLERLICGFCGRVRMLGLADGAGGSGGVHGGGLGYGGGRVGLGFPYGFCWSGLCNQIGLVVWSPEGVLWRPVSVSTETGPVSVGTRLRYDAHGYYDAVPFRG